MKLLIGFDEVINLFPKLKVNYFNEVFIHVIQEIITCLKQKTCFKLIKRCHVREINVFVKSNDDSYS
jgi:hypothetical protein